jgi:hypothetical protein
MIITWAITQSYASTNGAIAKRYFYLKLPVNNMTVEVEIVFLLILIANIVSACNPADVRGKKS